VLLHRVLNGVDEGRREARRHRLTVRPCSSR
jgi:hypothetical protein